MFKPREHLFFSIGPGQRIKRHRTWTGGKLALDRRDCIGLLGRQLLFIQVTGEGRQAA